MTGHGGPTEGDAAAGSGEFPEASGGFFDQLVESAGDAVVTADADGVVVYANDAVESLLGYDPERVRGRSLVDFAPGRLEDRYREWLARFAAGDGGTPLDGDAFEATWLTADGAEKRLSVSVFQHGADGRRLFTGVLRELPDAGRRAERIREDEALIDEIFDTSPIAISVRDADGELLRANARAAELVGLDDDPSKAVADESVADGYSLHAPDGEPMSFDDYPVGRVLRTGEPVSNEEIALEGPNGDRTYLSVSTAPIYRDGELHRVVTAAEDVTELKESQFELERRRAELETELAEVFRRVTDAFFALNDDWEFTYVNDTAEELLWRTEGELVGRNVWEVFPEAVGTDFRREYERAMERQEPVSFVELYPPLSRWFEVRAYPSETGLSVYFRDVTDRRERERELERYETIVETVEDGIYVLDDDMAFSAVNSALAEMTGYDREQLLGRSARTVTAEPWDDVERLEAEMLAGDRSAATVEVTVETADGDRFPAEATWVLRPTDDGHERVGVIRDVTERKARERELHERIEQQRALSEFSQQALGDLPIEVLFDEAVELVADTLDHDYGAVLERRPEDDDLVVRSGVGWPDGVAGAATVAADGESQAGRALAAAEPVVVSDLETDDRFSASAPFADRGVTRGIAARIGSADDPVGVLAVHDTGQRSYADYDVQFVRNIARVLTTAVRRRERDQQLERYETIVETVEDGVYALDPDERFVMVNDAFVEMTGYDREELLGEHASVVHSDAINERAGEMSESVADELGSTTLEFDLRAKDGGTIPVESRFGPYRYEDGRLARTGVVRDVTERRRFEQTLTALHESSRKLLQLETDEAVAESVLQTATDVLDIPGAGIYLSNEDGSTLRPAATSEYIEELFGEVPTFGSGDEAITWRAFADREPITLDDVRETDLAYRRDTPLRSGIWIPLGDHGVLAVVSEDVGAFDPKRRELADLLAATAEAALDRVERERQRREHERQLEAQNERLDAFASMLAHELRNPLEIAQIYLDMGVESAPTDADAARSFREVEQALDRIEEMIDTLLVVTRRSGDLYDAEVVDLGEAAAEWWAAMEGRDGTLDVLTDRRVRADPSRLRQLLENLYRNAEEHAGPDVTVRVGDLESGFYVEDDGPGVSEGTRERVFEPGYSTSNVGIGFGLAVVGQLAEAHGWDYEITESESGGARFEFRGVDVVDEA